MIRSDEAWLETLEYFRDAALGLQSWDEALRRLAQATGSRPGERVGLEGGPRPAFSAYSDCPIDEITRGVAGATAT